MRNSLLIAWAGLCAAAGMAAADAPRARAEGGRLVVEADAYLASFGREEFDFALALRDGRGRLHPAAREHTRAEFALVRGRDVRSTAGNRVRLRHAVKDGHVLVGLTAPLSRMPPVMAKAHFLCAQEGVLVGFRLEGDKLPADSVCWPLPRLRLDETHFDAYAFWGPDDKDHAGRIADLDARNVYAGVSPWGSEGDTVKRLSARRPALIARSQGAGVALGAVPLAYERDWAGAYCFLQRYMPDHLYFYPALAAPKAAAKGLWAWLAPFPAKEAAAGAKAERLLALGPKLVAGFEPIAPPPDEAWTHDLADFPAALRRKRPVADIREAVVYTVNESIHGDYGLALARKVGSDVLVRGWFKWRDARDYAASADCVRRGHALGALFGGGVTCSALYHGENGLSDERVRDMATRDPRGKLVNAWGQGDCRHGTLSNPAYLDYILSWCRRQIDAGGDYLFMDEINAALQPNEGFDDYSIRDFARFLLRRYCDGQGWSRDDKRWAERFRIDLADRAVCPDATMASFDYRAYLKSAGLIAKPHSKTNPLAGDWHDFRRERDDRAWKHLTDAIRAYAASKKRRVLISANGLARYVDLQVLGVWNRWHTRGGRVDLSESQIHEWASVVTAGWALAGRRVPVVFFHDWGFGGFPWMRVPPADRRLWMRVRGAEIYAAGGFFAFPVHGPFGNDALRDGTLAEVARQTAFYQRCRRLYLSGRVLGFEPLEASAPRVSLALWRRDEPPALLLHAVNRQAESGRLVPRKDLAVTVPVSQAPKSVTILSPDFPGERPGRAQLKGDRLTVVFPRLEAYAVAVLAYDALPRADVLSRRIVPAARWARPQRNEFVVQADGSVRECWALNGFLQGRLHTHLRNPPTFRVNLPRGGSLLVRVRAVATQGARLECAIDGKLAKAVDLADRDGKNDPSAAEYDKTIEFPLPPGRHRVAVRNTGGDWAAVAWYAFRGELAGWPPGN